MTPVERAEITEQRIERILWMEYDLIPEDDIGSFTADELAERMAEEFELYIPYGDTLAWCSAQDVIDYVKRRTL